MLVILGMGGFTTGGVNFDAKVRRESFEPIDLFYAHIGGMDAFARGLKIAQAIIADGRLAAFVKERYKSWDSELGRRVESGKASFADLEAYILPKGDVARNASGRQEMLGESDQRVFLTRHAIRLKMRWSHSMSTVAEPIQVATPPPLEPDGHYEVVAGRVQEKPPMGAFEGDVASLLTVILGGFVKAQRLGRVVSEMLFRLDPATGLSRRPDLAFLSYERWPAGRRALREAAWEVVPDVAIEVISPTNLANDTQDKIHDYFRAGVRAVWVIYPRNELIHVYDSPTSIRVLRAESGDDLDGGAVVPGFKLALNTLFGEDVA